jgi:glycosyltransferase involved in cell wall biosynthesis
MKKFSFIIPTHNEENIILDTLSVIRGFAEKEKLDYEIIVIDDCSQDDTILLLDRLKDDHIKVHYKNSWQGKGAALKTGWKIAKGDYIIFIDADLQIKPQELKPFQNLMCMYESDVVIGNKRNPYSSIDYSFARHVISIGYNLFVKILFGVSVSDTQCGLKLMKKSVLDKVMPKILCKHFAFDLELLVAFKENKIRVIDAPVCIYQSMRNSNVGFGSILTTFQNTLAVFWRKTRGHYKCTKSL